MNYLKEMISMNAKQRRDLKSKLITALPYLIVIALVIVIPMINEKLGY